MSTLAVLLICLTLATCGIAYWSDNLGKKLGKKRVTLFNLRPRQTATFITMASSVGIMLLTLAVLLATNVSVRNAFLRYDIVRRDNNRLTRANRAQAEALRVGQIQLRDNQVQLHDNEAKLLRAGSAVRLAQQGVTLAQGKLSGVRSELGGVRTELRSALQSKQDAVQSKIEAETSERVARASQRTAESRVRAARTRLVSVQSRLRFTQNRAVQAVYTAQQAEARARTARAGLRTANADLQKAYTDLQRVRRNSTISLRQALNSTQQAIEDRATAEVAAGVAQAASAAARAELEDSRRQLLRLKSEANGYFTQLSAGKFLAEPNLLLATRTIPANEPREAVEQTVSELLNEGSNAAKQLGAPDGVRLISSYQENGQVIDIPAEQSIRNLVTLLTGSATPMSLRLVSARYHVVGESQIDARFFYVPVERAFSRGDVLARTTLNPRDGDAKLFNGLLALTEQGRRFVEQDNRIQPLPTAQEPNFYAHDTNERVFEALRRVQSLAQSNGNQPVEVRLIAAQDLTTTEPLHVSFDVG